MQISSPGALARSLSALKLLRFMEPELQSESSQGVKLFQMYLEATRTGESSRDPDELDPADGLALLAANHFTSEWAAGNKGELISPSFGVYLLIPFKVSLVPLHQAIFVLEFASSRSPHNYQYRLLLIRLYLSIGS